MFGANWEREMELLDVLCDRERIGIDVGAKVGMYTYRIRDRSSKVIAFEPIPTFNHMLAKVFTGPRGRIEPYALSDRHGTAKLRLPWDSRDHGQWGRSTIEPANPLEHWQIKRTDEVEIETRTLDEYALSNVGFIKIDVEGHELAVLEGAAKTVADNRPNLLVECNDEHQPDGVAKLARWYAAHAYAGYFLFEKSVLSIDEFDPPLHWIGHGIENFIGIHEGRPEVLDAIKARLPTMKPAKPVSPDRARVRSGAGRA